MNFITLALTATLAQQAGWNDVLDLLDYDKDVRKQAIKKLEEAADPSLVAGINDVLYFHYVERKPQLAEELSELLEDITGEKVDGIARHFWPEWIGRREDIPPKDGYLLFKQKVFMRYDPAFRGYLNPRFTFRIRPEEIEWGGVVKDGIPALDNPGFIPADEADYLDDEERVFGVYINGVAKAYPHLFLDVHEMCNDVIAGIPVSLSYCTLCGSGVLYRGDHASRAGKKPFTFGSSGMLYRSNKLMYDRPTNSLWNNLTGQPVAGRLAESGFELDKLPLVVSTWKAWKAKHPDTLVMDYDNTGFERDYFKRPYVEYFASDETMFPIWLRSDALETKEFVFTLIINGQPKAYPLDVMKQERLSHDRVRAKSIVLLTEPETGAVRAYESKDHRFELADGGELRHAESGDTWTVSEEALTSPTGESLQRIAGHNAYWFGWYAFFPSTEIYEGANP